MFGLSGTRHVAYVITVVYVIEVNAVIWFWCEMTGCLSKGFAEGLFLKKYTLNDLKSLCIT